jgi:hypothetical protein
MTLRPENRALRALLWFVIIFVPGGMVLLAYLAADAVHRRYRADTVCEDGLGPDADLANASLSGISSTRA